MPPLATAERLPAPRQLMRALPTYDRPEHVYRLPPNTAGTATLGRRRPAAALGAPPPAALGAPPQAALGAPPPAALGDPPQAALGAPPPAALGAPPLAALGAVVGSRLPKSFAQKRQDRSVAYHLKRAGTATRAYDRKRGRNVCRTCGEVLSAETGHSQYRGYTFCERNRAGESLAVWRARVEREHAVKKAEAEAAAAAAAARQ